MWVARLYPDFKCSDTILVSLRKCFPTPQLSFTCEASSNISSTPGMKPWKSSSSSRSESLNNETKEYLAMVLPSPDHKGCVLTQFRKPSESQHENDGVWGDDIDTRSSRSCGINSMQQQLCVCFLLAALKVCHILMSCFTLAAPCNYNILSTVASLL